MHLGDYQEDYTKVNFTFFTTVDGTPTALAGTPAISVYKGNAVGQSTAGITLTEGFDGNTGSNQVLIDLSADAFYAIAEDYTIYLSAGTLGGVSVVGRPVAYFSIENREVTIDRLWDEAMVETTGAPAITGSMREFMQWWAALSRNVANQTETTTTLRNDADDGDLSTSTVSDDGVTFVRGEFST